MVSFLQTNTLNKLIIFTSKGNYIYVPIHEIPVCRWKDLGQHISNIVLLHPGESVVNAFIINEDIENPNVILFTKNGMVKRTDLNEYIVSRFSKTYMAINLKEDDELINASITLPHICIVTKGGYYLAYSSEEVTTSGPKAAGVKAINLKDDEVSGTCL